MAADGNGHPVKPQQHQTRMDGRGLLFRPRQNRTAGGNDAPPSSRGKVERRQAAAASCLSRRKVEKQQGATTSAAGRNRTKRWQAAMSLVSSRSRPGNYGQQRPPCQASAKTSGNGRQRLPAADCRRRRRQETAVASIAGRVTLHEPLKLWAGWGVGRMDAHQQKRPPTACNEPRPGGQTKGPVTVKVQVPNMQDKTEWKLNGQVLVFTLPLSDQVSVIKVKIHEATGMPAGKQKLQYEGIFIKDSNSLAYYNMTSGSVIHLALKERERTVHRDPIHRLSYLLSGSNVYIVRKVAKFVTKAAALRTQYVDEIETCICGAPVIEDIAHILFDCELYSDPRQNYLSELLVKVSHWSVDLKLSFLLHSPNAQIVHSVAKFIFRMTGVRSLYIDQIEVSCRGDDDM
ncbi:hypothetical protein JRQ81_007685 [Phrynocephalus forsythii]|uniref:Ubiquitin-like domain-containing protein n=1 Tax=Phrynocephalus forsythii TaxID=171643 RepID=A0A9Q0XC13_9SAUR|nr:hypothetical protein JRQ81_007685 [Phrynocephalus forsythii]